MFEFDVIQCGMLILFLMVLGEIVSHRMKAAIPAILVSALFYMGAVWAGIFPNTLVQTSGLTHLTSIAMMFVIINMGASTNPKELLENWKVVALAAISYFVQIATMVLVISTLYDRNLAIGSLPGGASVALMVQERARSLGYDNVVLLSAMLLSVKGLVSCPLASVIVRREVKRRKKEGIIVPEAARTDLNSEPGTSGKEFRTESAYMALFRFFFTAWLASRLEMATGVSRYVFCLLLGVLLTKVGFLYKNIMDQSKSQGMLMLMMMTMALEGFSSATPELFMKMMVPMVCVLSVEVLSVTLNSFLFGRFFGFSREMSYAICLNVMVGFPLNMMLAQDIIGFLVKDPYEKEVLNREIATRMVIAGFTSVTFLSTITMGVLVGFIN
ncbi:MAG: hypothetical protein IJ374_03600 [Lachnospiraceae bacterium]|nr:hypothetical protein [Lachnospiraceae bacterium]